MGAGFFLGAGFAFAFFTGLAGFFAATFFLTTTFLGVGFTFFFATGFALTTFLGAGLAFAAGFLLTS